MHTHTHGQIRIRRITTQRETITAQTTLLGRRLLYTHTGAHTCTHTHATCQRKMRSCENVHLRNTADGWTKKMTNIDSFFGLKLSRTINYEVHFSALELYNIDIHQGPSFLQFSSSLLKRLAHVGCASAPNIISKQGKQRKDKLPFVVV